ncbi:sensor histidine kinase [Diaphorobacter caeni]|uniref:sensor histidine kinase n=1 Tax=Diaphorobacter caeni TaxID=2784387 RepID=UPI0018905C32|nr:HAMP domain-containing sensor histidine kinase [Diaphorobacter caeni]MBF5005944.1 sensor histidine kinase [Diaphorobacter caeni]
MAIHVALFLTLLETIALSAVLLVWANQVRGARLLVVFLAGVATWIVGNELPNWFGIATAPLAMALLSTLPLTSAAFLHFCLIFCHSPIDRRWIHAAYAGAALTALHALLRSPGEFEHFEPFTGVEWVVVPNHVGWMTSLVWACFAALGILALLMTFFHAASAQRRRQIGAVAISCGWGLLAMSGYAFAALKIPVYPWQVLAAPVFPVILVYGILRYRVFVANVWARRALASVILMALGVLVVPLTVLLPFESRWVVAIAVAATTLALRGPVWNFASRLVYPGGTLSAEDWRQWRMQLSQADTMEQLQARATAMLSQRMGMEIQTRIARDANAQALSQTATEDNGAEPTLVCSDHAGEWQTQLFGFEEAPPGQLHLAELFGTLLADAAANVERSEIARQRERESQLNARLAELGSLATTVAHDLRNPLNIIAMAVALAPQETRQEVGEQITRISRLTEDLLDYAKPWQIHLADTDIAARISALIRRMPEVETGPGLGDAFPVRLDPVRFDQAVVNLLTNARQSAASKRVLIDAERRDGAVLVHVCDDGPGIPDDLRERLFQPFASRSPGGTGLGLAIVARIMSAHGGTAELTERAPWHTCFTLTFPTTENTAS